MEELLDNAEEGGSNRWLITNGMALGQEALIAEPVMLLTTDIFFIFFGGAAVIECLEQTGIIAP